MFFGILAGFLSAFLQSTAHFFSRRFVLKHHEPGRLVVCSQAFMGIFGVITLAATLPFVQIPLTAEFFLSLAGAVAASNVGYFCFFRAAREVEASRLSSLLGLKIIILAAINALLLHQMPHGTQYPAVLFATIAAVGMNFTGGPLSRKVCGFLLLNLFAFATSDLMCTRMVLLLPGDRLFLNSIAVTAVTFAAMGAFSSLAFFRMKCPCGCFIDAIPYAVSWYLAMIFLFASFGATGVLFGNIIQASRGLISVLLGVLLLKAGFDRLEPRVGVKAWIRRAVMAILMFAAMALYSLAK